MVINVDVFYGRGLNSATQVPGGRLGHWITRVARIGLFCVWAVATVAAPLNLSYPAPTLDRWVYPFGDFDGQRSVAPTWASFDVRFDTRDGQFLLAWDTAGQVPTNAPASRYLVRRVRVTVEHTPLINQPSFEYDPTYDSFRTYLTNALALPDEDTGRPTELFGVGYRGGFTALTFQESSPYGVIFNITNPTNVSIGTRNAYAADFGPDGLLRDVSNNVGQANEPFEVEPFAVGRTAAVIPGEPVPDGTRFSFDLDLSRPLVVAYLQEALRQGRLPLMLSALHRARSPAGGAGVGGGVYPNWVAKESLLGEPATLEFEGLLIGDADTDADGLPDDWENWVFGDLRAKGTDDGDGDGADNRAEFFAGTDPKNAEEVLRILELQAGPGQKSRLRFKFAPSRHYRVETGSTLGSWQPAEGHLVFSPSGAATWTANEPAADGVQFFRLVVEE